MNIYVALAKKTIFDHFSANSAPNSAVSPAIRKQKAGCFVSLHTKNGKLRGCIGTILPTTDNLASEIKSNALAACLDPRFLPVSRDEINDLDIQVDVLSEPEPIASKKQLDPKKYGVIVRASGARTGLLLPDLEGIDEVEKQISVARQKAGIGTTEPVDLYRFRVARHKEK